VSNEIKAAQSKADSELAIRVNTNTFEITAAYTFEEAELDIAIKLPSCYPLKLVEVSSGSAGGRQAGIREERWRGWLLSIASIVIGHNGSISDALVLFKKNVSMHFEGFEDCAICYSVISLADRSTPNKACKVCKHQFHGSCLYKWFKSSNQNSCPLCRQPM
jgi:Ring finger domain